MLKIMTVEIWSDVMCPFCYIGKRKFEAALEQFEHQGAVEIVWRSFQLNPSLETEPNKSVLQSLMEQKGWSAAQAKQIMSNVVNMAKSVGLDYDFDKAVVANSFDAHRFTHFAKSKGKQDAAEEALFKAYFIEGRNTADHSTLAALGETIGLDGQETMRVLQSNDFAAAVNEDINLARQFGINSVPFFVFNRKYAVSGAQEEQVFLETMQQVAP